MSGAARGLALGLTLGLGLAAPVLGQEAETTAAPASSGQSSAKAVYDRWCAGCHGVDGTGNGVGAGFMLPRPRDFTQASYQIRTTSSGDLPTDADILHVINVGMPGTAMPGWEDKLSDAQREALVDYLKSFSRFFDPENPPEPIEVGGAPGGGEDAVAAGRELYERFECGDCHGTEGRGDGASAPTMDDENGFPIRPADLTENWNFNGGGSVEAIYTRLLTGLNGTPMPSLQDVVAAGQATTDDIWNLAQYVRSLSPEEPPRAADVLRARRVESALPATATDSMWLGVERFYVPLVGQVIAEPRQFAPTVDGVWVQALHDGSTLALRLSWHDPSRSPSAAWSDWRRMVAETVEPTGAAPPGPAPDRFAVQFPTRAPEGMEMPYFLMGDEDAPVNLWEWQSDPGAVRGTIGRGLHDRQALDAEAQAVSGSAAFDAGAWHLLLRRPLVPPDTTRQMTFTAGVPIPIAFFAWDGDNGEVESPGSVSSWVYLWLDEPASSSIYVIPVSAMVLTALLGVVVVARAQRRERMDGAGDVART